MKILHLSTNDAIGGAARAAFRLHRGLVGCGVHSSMLVQTKYSNDPLVSGSDTQIGRLVSIFKYLVDSTPAIVNRCGRGATFSPAILPDRILRYATRVAPDIVHLHWISGGFMRIETITDLDRPIVWTLHDMWPFTGGCHYDGECCRYTGSCGYCPELKSVANDDLSWRIWQRKVKAWRGVPMTIITPSRWMARCAASSSLFSEADIRVIPNGIDTSLFQPGDRSMARKTLGLPLDQRLILFGAMSPTSDPRKGFQHLLPAIRDLANNGWGENTELLVYGGGSSKEMPDFGMKAHYMGSVNDDTTLSLLNVAADVVVAPSVQENLSNTVMESMACGTPVVAFKIGGMVDMIDHCESGWLTHPFNHKDLARGIAYVIENDRRRERMGMHARKKIVREYAENIVARQHINLYEELLK